jgi:hypothetical protein
MKKEAHTMNEKTLTSEQRATLIAYILMTTKMREEEAAAWDKLAEEKTAGGQPRFRHAAANAQYWRELQTKLTEIIGILEA